MTTTNASTPSHDSTYRAQLHREAILLPLRDLLDMPAREERAHHKRSLFRVVCGLARAMRLGLLFFIPGLQGTISCFAGSPNRVQSLGPLVRISG